MKGPRAPRRSPGAARPNPSEAQGPLRQQRRRRVAQAAEPVVDEGGRDRRAEILGIAGALIAEHGFEAATLRQIGDAAGILGGSLYHHFVDKNEILHELLSPLRGDSIARARAIVAKAALPDQALRRLLRFTIDRVAESPHRHSILNNEDSYFRRTPEFEYAWIYGREYAELFHDVLKDGVRSGAFRADLDIDLAKVLVLKIVNTTPLWFQPGGRYSIEAAIDAQMDLILHGVRTRSPKAAAVDPAEIRRAIGPVLDVFRAGCLPSHGRRSELLKIAAAVFAERGFEAASVRHISEAAGILSASVYHHFRDKNEILHELVRNFATDLVSAYQAIVHRPDPADVTFFRIVAFATAALTEFPHLNAILNKEDRFFRRTPSFTYAWTYGQDIARVFYGMLQEGQRAGLFRPGLRIEIVTVVVTKLISAMVDWEAASGQFGADALIAGELDLIGRGIGSEAAGGS